MALPPHEALMDVAATECGICYEPYGTMSQSRAPKTLLCGHCLCLSCLQKLVSRNRVVSFISCPFCRTITIVPEEGIQALKPAKETLCIASKQKIRANLGPICSQTRASASTFSYSTGSSSNLQEVPEQSGSHWPPIFTISSLVSPYCSGFQHNLQTRAGLQMQEHQTIYLASITEPRAAPEPPPPLTSPASCAENVRICFAIILVVFIVSIFLMIVFLK